VPAIVSPIHAPANGPKIIPRRPKGPIIIPVNGKIKTATISPTVLPTTPALLPPNFFVP